MVDKASHEMSSLAPLVGEWDFTSSVDGKPTGRGRTTFEPIEGGAFLRQTADDEPAADAPPEWAANSPMPITAIIGLDDTTGTLVMLYSDARGVRRIYHMSLTDGVLKLWRDAPEFHQRFTGRFAPDGGSITGRWEMSTDGSEWDVDFEMTYTRAEPVRQ